MGAEVQHRVGAPHLFKVGVVSGEAVVGAGAARIQQPHRVAFVAEGGLHPHKHVAEVAAVNQQVGAIAIQIAGRLAPVLFEALGVGGEALVFGHAHPVGNRQLRRSLQGLGIGEHRLHQRLGRAGHVGHAVPLELHLLKHPEDRTEHIEVGGGAHVALVGGEAEHGDRQLLLSAGLDPQ